MSLLKSKDEHFAERFDGRPVVVVADANSTGKQEAVFRAAFAAGYEFVTSFVSGGANFAHFVFRLGVAR